MDEFLGKVVYEFNVKIGTQDVVTWRCEEHKIIGENKDYFCINNLHFDTLIKVKNVFRSSYSALDEVSLIDWTSGGMNCSGLGKFSLCIYTLNPSHKSAQNKINARLRKYVKSKISPYVYMRHFNVNLNQANKELTVK